MTSFAAPPTVAARAPGTRVLTLLFVLNVVSTMVHYGHNVMYLPRYFEIPFFTARNIDGFWFVMTAIGVVGMLCQRAGRRVAAFRLLYLYCGCSLLVLGHYNPMWSQVGRLRLEIHLLIAQEVVLALLLAGYVRQLQRRAAAGCERVPALPARRSGTRA
jgi:hypothetical protein